MPLISGILLVDDDIEDQAIFIDALQSLSQTQQVYVQSNGADALKYLKQVHASDQIPCVILADLNMPKMGGIEFLNTIKQDDRFARIPILIYTTSINHRERELCLRLGAYDYVTKPLNYKESIAFAQKVLDICMASSREE